VPDEPVSTAPVSTGLTLTQLSMTEFRLFEHAVVEPAPVGTTVLTGPNGSGKTTVLEAVAYLGSLRSFRGAPRDAMVRIGAERGYVRAELVEDGRRVSVETELSRDGRDARAQLNRQRARRADLAAAVPVTIFSPVDLSIVQGGPAGRRVLLDDALAVLDRRSAVAVEDTERALRQRSALLRQAGGRLSAEVESSLDVWDERLAAAATVLVAARRALVSELSPLTDQAYRSIAEDPSPASVTLRYVCSWEGPLSEALAQRRKEDVRRAATSAGPHRDELAITLEGRDARVQASQGEQRSLALAVRLGIHRLLSLRLGRPPLLLLDDVFSELDPGRSQALLGLLPSGQSLLSTASPLPAGWEIAAVVDVTRLAS
jgi:DNA replication and repair protein RecF